MNTVSRFALQVVVAVSLVLGSACGGEPLPGGTDETTPSAGFTTQEPTTSPVRPTCRINDKVATSRASALSQWGEPCSRDTFGDVETWQYAVTRCRLETMAGPLDDFCPVSCDSTSARYAVTFTRDVVSECEAPALQPAVAPPTYTVTRYSHTDDASTRLGAQCPGGAVLVGGVCSCAAPGALIQSELTGSQLQVMECACSSGGVTVEVACLSSDSATLRDGTP